MEGMAAKTGSFIKKLNDRLAANSKPFCGSLSQKIIGFFRKPEQFFLIFSGFFGLLFVFLIPPMQAPDEHMHLYRSYQTASFGIFAEEFKEGGETRYGSRIPVSLEAASNEMRMPVAGNPALEFNSSLLGKYASMPLNEYDTVLVKTEAVNVYSPVPYIPQAVGMGVGKIFNTPPLFIIWLGRIANLVFWLVAVYWAIRLLPFAKWGLVVLALNPVTTTLAASLSGDSVSIGLAFLFVSLIFWTRKTQKKQPNSMRIITVLASIAIVLCLTKPTNLLLLPLLLMVPRDMFWGRLRLKLFVTTAIIALAFATGLAWNIGTKPILEIATETLRPGYGVSPSGQMSYIFSNPVEYTTTVINNFVYVGGASSANAVLGTYLGVFGWLDSSIPLWTQILYVVVLVIAVLYQYGRGVYFSIWCKVILLVVFALTFGAAVTAMYLNYTPVGAKIFEGVQGRYFMPASVVLLGIFTGRNKLLIIKNNNLPIVILLCLTVVYLMTLIKLIARYYIS